MSPNFETLNFNFFPTQDQKRTLSLLEWVTASLVVEAIVRQRAFQPKPVSEGPLAHLGKFNRIAFLNEYMDDKGHIYPFAKTHYSVLLGAVKLAESIITNPGFNQKQNTPVIPGEHLLRNRGGVHFSLNSIVSNQEIILGQKKGFKQKGILVNLHEVETKNETYQTFFPSMEMMLPHLGKFDLILRDEKRTMKELNAIINNFTPTYIRFMKKTNTKAHENYWIVSMSLIRKHLCHPGTYILPHVNLDLEPFIERSATSQRQHDRALHTSSDQTSSHETGRNK